MVKKEIVIEGSKVAHSKEKALRRSIYEGSAASLSSGFGDTYITPFALALKASNFHIGLLSSLSGLFAPLAQYHGSKLMEKFSRKRIVLHFVFLQALMWLPIALLGYLFWKGIFAEYLPLALIGLYALLAIFGGIAYPAWFSWMGDLVPEDERGKYFGKRNKITGAVGLAAVLIAGFLLDYFKTRGFALIGFMSLFVLAFVFRIVSFAFFKRQFNPKFKLKKGYYFSLWAFLKRYDNFGKFAVFQACFYFALMIASPFFAVYMLKELNFSYVTFIIVSMSSSVFYLFFASLAGKFSDRYGNLKLLKIGSYFFVLSPIPWLFLKNPIWLIFIPNLIAGIANAAFVIAVNNFTYDAVKPEHRGLCVAYMNILVGIGVFLGSLLGGFVANMEINLIKPILLVFVISAFLRLLVNLFFLHGLKEVRRVKRTPHFSVSLVHPFKALHADVGWFKNFFK